MSRLVERVGYNKAGKLVISKEGIYLALTKEQANQLYHLLEEELKDESGASKAST